MTRREGADLPDSPSTRWSAPAPRADLLMIDTAGRLQNKQALMDELARWSRAEKLDPEAPHDVVLVLDATTGHNAPTRSRCSATWSSLTGL